MPIKQLLAHNDGKMEFYQEAETRSWVTCCYLATVLLAVLLPEALISVVCNLFLYFNASNCPCRTIRLEQPTNIKHFLPK